MRNRIVVSALLCFSLPCLSASYYISTTGSDSNNCTNQTTDACGTFMRCNQVMSAGDTCYALSGTYTTSGLRGWYLTGTGGTSGNVKTFRGMPDQEVIIQPTSFLNATQEGTITIYSNNLDYVTFSDFTFYGRFDIQEPLTEAADDITLERIVFKCPGAAGTGNTTSIEGQNKIDGTVGVPRERLTIRNNLFTIDSTCPSYAAWGSSTSYQPDYMHLYSCNNPVIENNDFIIEDYTKLYDRAGDPDMRFAVWMKGISGYSEIRYNYCTGEFGGCYIVNTGKCPDGLTCSGQSAYDSAGQNAMHHNISDRGGSIGWDSNNWSDGDYAYNNTIYRPWGSNGGISISPSTADSTRGRVNHSIFNNLIVSQVGDTLGGYYGYLYLQPSYGQADQVACLQSVIDYNMYYPVDAAKSANFRSNTVTKSSLSDWNTWLTANCANTATRETNSRTDDPGFADAAGHDFSITGGSPAASGGRGGSYPSYIGALDPDGTNVVGCTFHPKCSSYNASSAPAPVSGPVRRVDLKGVAFK